MCAVWCVLVDFFLLIRRPPSATRTAPPFPDTTLFRSDADGDPDSGRCGRRRRRAAQGGRGVRSRDPAPADGVDAAGEARRRHLRVERDRQRSEEHTSELQSLMRSSYAVFCLKKKKETEQSFNITIL